MSLPFMGPQDWPQHSRQDSPGVSRGRIACLNLLATLLLMQQPERQLAFFATRAHFCLMVSLLLSGLPGPLQQSCFLSG